MAPFKIYESATQIKLPSFNYKNIPSNGANIRFAGKIKQVDQFKGALDNFSLIPIFFFKKVEIFISLEVYTYVVTAC